MQKPLGIALDIGTTTISGKLIDLDLKKGLSSFSCLNEQVTFGADIISRIKLSLKKPKGLEKLHKKIISSINYVIKNLLTLAGDDKSDITLIACAGNTAIYHFVLNLSLKKLTQVPYEPKYKAFVKQSAHDLGIDVEPGTELDFLPNIGGFAGSDSIAVILASRIDKSPLPVLAVDIGTNGEIIFGSNDRIYVASTAAGPAFEGWHLACGMRAVEGAIESIEDKKGELSLSIIGNIEPKGIAGSAFVDITAILLKRGLIDKTGRMKKDFVISSKGKKIFISKNDIRQIQLAKAAFSAGISSLRRLYKNDLLKFIITGNFGTYLNKDNAKNIGIIPPDIEAEKIEFLKDGALSGVEVFIKDREAVMGRIDNILQKTEHIVLARDKNFQKEFIRAISF